MEIRDTRIVRPRIQAEIKNNIKKYLTWVPGHDILLIKFKLATMTVTGISNLEYSYREPDVVETGTSYNK